jgi:2-methylcitrate dehydratase PrpD
VAGRVGEAVCLPRTGQYFHGNGTANIFGTAAAAGKLLDLNAPQLANALGIAGDGASGLREFSAVRGMQCKPLHVGRAVQTGVTAGLLAAEGFEGAATILEGRYGFCNAMTPEPRPELICLELGQRFAVVESGFKFYAGGGGPTHVEAALWLREKHNLDPRSIQRIRVGLPTSDGNRSFSGYLEETMAKGRPPASVGHARFSTSYRVAAALCDGEMTHRQLSTAKLTDPAILALEKLVEFTADAEVQEIANSLARDEPFAFVPSMVEIESGGQTYRHLVRKPLGYDIERALTQEQVEIKFRSAVKGILSEKQADGVVNWVAGLDGGSKVGELAELVA